MVETSEPLDCGPLQSPGHQATGGIQAGTAAGDRQHQSMEDQEAGIANHVRLEDVRIRNFGRGA
jgi:hypothetical protein